MKLFDRVKELVDNAIENGYNPLAASAKELAEDMIEKTGELTDEALEHVETATQQVKDFYEKKVEAVKDWTDKDD